MPSLACPAAPTEPRNFWLPESPEGCEAENCTDPDHSKLCGTCKARLCSEHAKRCECDSYHCASCLFRHEDMELCLTCFKNAKGEWEVMSDVGMSVNIHCEDATRLLVDRELFAEDGTVVVRIGFSATLFLTPANEAALLAALTKGQPQPVVALLESVEESAVGA